MRSFRAWLRGLGAAPATLAARIEPQVVRVEPRMLSITPEQVARSKARVLPFSPFEIPKPPPGIVPAGAEMAMDDGIMAPLSWASSFMQGGAYGPGEGIGFMGYPYLSELAQRPEYRRMSETYARHMTRRWIKLKGKGKGSQDKTKKIADLEGLFRKLDVQGEMRRSIEADGFFGRGHIYIDLGTSQNPIEERTPIGNGWDSISAAKVRKGGLKGIRSIEPLWTYPSAYNTGNPKDPSFYKPMAWYTMGLETHCTRLLTLVSRPVPDLLKSAYAFGGLSLSQMAKPYVDNWIRTRASVSDIIRAFSVFVLATDMVKGMGQAGPDIFARAELFNNMRDNSGILLIDKEREDFQNVAASLANLDRLQAQAQEHMSSVCAIPLVEFLGLQPAGLNASSDGEIETFKNNIHAAQEQFMRPTIHAILGFAMLSEFGAVDEDIVFDFEPLSTMDDVELAEKRNKDAQTDKLYVDAGVLDVEEVRKRIAGDEDSPYDGLVVADIPEPPAPPLPDPAALPGKPDATVAPVPGAKAKAA